jgi:uncharacterized protein
MKKIHTKLFEIVTSKVKETALRFDPNAEVILFGSRARGDYRKDSDWDFLILTDLMVDWKLKGKIREEMFDTELETKQGITTILQNRDYWNKFFFITDFHQNIKDDGIKL